MPTLTAPDSAGTGYLDAVAGRLRSGVPNSAGLLPEAIPRLAAHQFRDQAGVYALRTSAQVHRASDSGYQNERYRYWPIAWYYWSMVIRRDEYLVTTAREPGARREALPDSGWGDAGGCGRGPMGIGQPYLSSLEGGKFGNSLTHVLRLLRFVGCEVIIRPRQPRG